VNKGIGHFFDHSFIGSFFTFHIKHAANPAHNRPPYVEPELSDFCGD
jgi:hypothetical protein